MPETILALDIGLSNCKAVLFNGDGTIAQRASVPYPTYRPRPGWVEQDPEAWWQAVVAGMAELRERAPRALAQVAAISVTGHMHALVSLGDEGEALGPALVLGDQRSLAEADAITRELGMERIYQLTGARMDASMPLAKLRWLGAHAPDVHRRARAFLACKDWVRHRLTGDVATDPIDACGSSIYDIQKRAWSPELASLGGIRTEQLPPVLDPCTVAGRLQTAAARALGLSAELPVVVGAGDDVEVLGSRLMAPGLSLEHLGTTGSILTCVDRPAYDPAMALELYPHVAPGLWVLGGSVTMAGSALAWADAVLSSQPTDGEEDGPTDHPDLDSPLIFLPHLAGERCPHWEPQARGGWVGLSSTHTARDLRRAALEGVCFSLRDVLQRIESLVGPQARVMVSGNGAGEARLALQAAIYGRPLGILATDEPTALGAMILAGVGTGLYRSLEEAVRRATCTERLIEPEADLAQDYDHLYEVYGAVAAALRPLLRHWRHMS